MRKNICRVISFMLCAMLLCTCVPWTSAFAADAALDIFSGDAAVTDVISLQEYQSVQLSAHLTGAPDGSTVQWSSNLPLNADVDDTGKVTAYDYSKRAIIQLWIDENVASKPVVGPTMASAIWAAIDKNGIDVDNADTDAIVLVVSSVAGETLGNSLGTFLKNNMNVKITAVLVSSSGEKITSDTVEVKVEKSVIASVAPTGVHITNKRTVPTTVAVGTTAQLYGVCTPLRLKQGVQWAIGKNALDTSGSDVASVTSGGLVSFKKAGTVTVRLNPSSTIYAAFSDTITFTVLEQSALPVKDFEITSANGSSSVTEGSTLQLAVDHLTPAGAYTGNLKWTSSDSTVAAVDANGLVTGLDGGSGLTTYSKKATITATIGSVSKTFEVTVKRQLVSALSSVAISGNTVVGIGASEQLTSTVSPTRLNTSSSVQREWGVYIPSSSSVIYASSDTPATDGVVSVDSNGVVSGVKAGVSKVCVRATYGSGSVENSMMITCGKAVTSFSISGTSTITEGKTTQLTVADIAPADYDADLLKSIVWSSSDPSVASISADGLVLGRDGGGRLSSSTKTATISASISGVTKTVEITVKGTLLSKYTDASVDGPTQVIRDLPYKYTMTSYPSRIGMNGSCWGLATDDGTAPWKQSLTLDTSKQNADNSTAHVDSDGTVHGLKVGSTTLYAYMRQAGGGGYLTSIDASKKIDVIEIAPRSIIITAPKKCDYVEGSAKLDTTGLAVALQYNKDDIAPYYPNAASYTDEQLKVGISDYTVGEINPDILDAEQYIVVSTERGGKSMKGIFPVVVHSKDVTSLTLTAPTKTDYAQGDTALDLTGMKVVANYSNAASEEVTDYTVDTSSFNPMLYDVAQQVTVVYTHAGKTATATFPVTVYGTPVLTVKTTGTIGKWTKDDISFKFSATHPLDGLKYYVKKASDSNWILAYQDSYTIKTNTRDTLYFKAVNSHGVESNISTGYSVMLDNTVPSFDLIRSNTALTNQNLTVDLKNMNVGSSGIASITLNGSEIYPATSFAVSENGEYTVRITSGSGETIEKSIGVTNIDKIAPTVDAITLSQEPADGFMRELQEDFGKYFSGPVVATASATDQGVAGIASLKWRLVDENRQPVSDWATYNENDKPTCAPNFRGYFEFQATDRAGNISESRFSDGFTTDGDKPVISVVTAMAGDKPYVNGSWTSSAVTFTPKAEAFSGIYQFSCKIDDGNWNDFSSESFKTDTEGTHHYYFKAISKSGYESDQMEFTINIDRTTPVLRVASSGVFGGWTDQGASFKLSTLTLSPSGVTYYYDLNASGDWQKIVGDTISFSSDVVGSCRFKAVNGAGTESVVSDSYQLKIDTTVPTANVIRAVTEKTAHPYEVTIVPVCGASGIKKVYFDGEDITSSLKVTVSKNGRYILTVIGNNGLSSVQTVVIDNFGKVPDGLFTYSEIDASSAAITAYNGNSSAVTVPCAYGKRTVTTLSAGVFQGNTAVQAVTLQDGLQEIGSLCFGSCTSLTKLVIPSSVTKIGDYAFSGCTALTIYCYAGSFAEQYAKDNKIPYVVLSLEPIGKTEIDEDNKQIVTDLNCGHQVNSLLKVGTDMTSVGVPSLVAGKTEYYGTGSKIHLFKDGKETDTYTVVVRGDVNGDSVTDAMDLMSIALVSNSQANLSGAYLSAADYDNSGDVGAADYQAAVNQVIG